MVEIQFAGDVLIILVLVGIFAAVVGWKKRKEGKYEETNYKTFFVLGVSLAPLGIVFSAVIGPSFFGIAALGVIYMLIGIANKDKWYKPKKAPRKKAKKR
ncbi:MAG: hypothetical protein ABIE55_00610 [Candidatus Aenigmatarchaeota archaeon]